MTIALEPLAYDHAGTALTGFLARPSGTPRAAVVIFPTILNGSPRIDLAARDLAAAGYLALIADFYGERPASFEASGPLAAALRGDVGHYRGRLHAGVAALRAVPGATDLRVAAFGYCMGGQAVLELARDGADLAAVVSFHGILTTAASAQPGAVRARILVCHGDADPLAPRDQVLGFWQEMDAAGANWHFHSYSGVRHGFTDPASDARGLPAIGYDASADRQSWASAISLLDEVMPA